MAPGIYKLDDVHKGDKVSIRVRNNAYPFGVGVSEVDTVAEFGDVSTRPRGKAVQMLHVYGDMVWKNVPVSIPNEGFSSLTVVTGGGESESSDDEEEEEEEDEEEDGSSRDGDDGDDNEEEEEEEEIDHGVEARQETDDVKVDEVLDLNDLDITVSGDEDSFNGIEHNKTGAYSHHQ